jgi:hypothetical protein
VPLDQGERRVAALVFPDARPPKITGAPSYLSRAGPATDGPASLANLMSCDNYAPGSPQTGPRLWGGDGFGNRTLAGMTSTDCNGGNPGTATYNTNNQVTFANQSAPSSVSAPSGFSYDQAGNVTNDGANTYLYVGVPVDRSWSTGREGEGRPCDIHSYYAWLPNLLEQ